MTKLKLMLLSLSVLAIVGGAVAFTAKQGAFFCIAIVTEDAICPNLTCPDLAAIVPTTEAEFLCSTVSVNDGCTLPSGAVKPCAGNPQRWTLE